MLSCNRNVGFANFTTFIYRTVSDTLFVCLLVSGWVGFNGKIVVCYNSIRLRLEEFIHSLAGVWLGGSFNLEFFRKISFEPIKRCFSLKLIKNIVVGYPPITHWGSGGVRFPLIESSLESWVKTTSLCWYHHEENDYSNISKFCGKYF